MVVAVNWKLLVDSKALGRAGFGIEGGQIDEFYVPDGKPTNEDLTDFLLETLGDVEIDASAHKLKRRLPKAHPVFPWLFAHKLEYQGIGYRDSAGATAEIIPATAGEFLEAEPITDNHYRHVRVQAHVWFAPRPYAVLADASIEPENITYKDDTGTDATEWDSGEYDRYTYPLIDPQPQLATAQQGQLVYRTGSQVMPPHTNTFSGFPYIVIPDGDFQVVWSHVPYSLILDDSHPMHTLVGRINQTTFFGRAPGKLLYMGARSSRPYTPLVPEWSFEAAGATFTDDKLCDITFHFRFTARVGSDLPTPANANWLAAGWNLQPYWLTRAFHYVTAPGESASSWVPQFRSVPMQFLFYI